MTGTVCDWCRKQTHPDELMTLRGGRRKQMCLKCLETRRELRLEDFREGRETVDFRRHVRLKQLMAARFAS